MLKYESWVGYNGEEQETKLLLAMICNALSVFCFSTMLLNKASLAHSLRVGKIQTQNFRVQTMHYEQKPKTSEM